MKPSELFPTTGSPPIELEEVVLSALPPEEVDSTLRDVAQRYRLHTVTHTDLLHRNQRSKIELFEDYLFIVWHHYWPGKREPTELHFVFSGNHLLLVASHPPRHHPSWRRFFFDERTLKPLRPAALALLDRMILTAQEFVDDMFLRTNALETKILENRAEPNEILELRSTARAFAHRVAQAKEVLTESADTFGFHGDDRLIYRKVLDHFSRMQASHDQLMLQIVALFDVYWGQAGLQTNMELKRLTLIATLALPVALWSSFFGMNFASMPFNSTWFFLFGLSLMIASVTTILIYLRRRGLLKKRSEISAGRWR